MNGSQLREAFYDADIKKIVSNFENLKYSPVKILVAFGCEEPEELLELTEQAVKWGKVKLIETMFEEADYNLREDITILISDFD